MKHDLSQAFVDQLSFILVANKNLKLKDLPAIHKRFNEQSDLSFIDFLLEEGLVNKPDLLEALSEYYQVPALDVTGEFFDHHHLRFFPKSVMIRHFFIPYHRENDELTVVTANPNDPHLRVVIGKYVTHYIDYMVGLPQDIVDAVREYYDQSITYQPNDISNQKMERSQQEVHSIGEELKQEGKAEDIPEIWEETVDDYESK